MTSLRDQFSAVRKAQFEAQFDFFNSMTTQALENASRVAALNLAVSRDSLQRSLGAGFALMNSRDPRDVLTLGGQAEEQMRSLFAYGRELLGIASGVRPYAVRPQALSLAQSRAPELAIETVEVIERGVAETAAAEVAPTAAAPVEAAAAVVSDAEPVARESTDAIAEAAAEAVAEAASEVVAEAVPAAEPAPAAPAAAAPVAEPVVVAEPEPAPEPLAVIAEPVPVAEPKAIAKAAGKGSARAGTAAHPAAAPVDALATGEGAEVPKLATPSGASRRKK